MSRQSRLSRPRGCDSRQRVATCDNSSTTEPSIFSMTSTFDSIVKQKCAEGLMASFHEILIKICTLSFDSAILIWILQM